MIDQLTIPALTDEEAAIVNGLWKQLQAKAPRNLLRASYYDGKRALQQVGSVIPPQYYRLGIVLGWSAKAVDILARRCNLDGMVWPDGDLGSIGWNELAEANAFGSEIDSSLTSTLIHSVSFLVATKGDTTQREPKALVHVKDAMNATGTWNQRTRSLDNLLSITSRNEDGDPTGLVLYLYNLTIICTQDGGRWTVERQEHTWGVPAWPVVYKPREGRRFGSSRISRAVMSLHDQALRTVIRLEGHMDVYSFPEFWLLGADMSMFKNADGSQKAAWQVMLGRIKAIPDDDEADQPRADVKQFSASDPEPHIKALKQQAQLFSGETSIPLTSLGVSDMSNPTSADSYIASREDLIAEAEGVTSDSTTPIRKAALTALAMWNDLSEIPEEWKSIDCKWRSPVYLSKAAAADGGSKQVAAVPWLAETEVGLELLGLTDQQITRALAERRRNGGSAALRAIVKAAEEGRPAVTSGNGQAVPG